MNSPAGQHTIREHNLALVLRHIAESAPISRAQIAEASGLTKAAVSALVEALMSSDLLVELEPDRGSRGRPASPLALNPNGPAGLGVEINVDYISVGVLDLTGRMRAERTTVVDNRRISAADGLHRAVELLREARAEVPHLKAAGATLAVPGLVDADGVLRRAPNLPHWQGVDVAGQLSAALELPVGVENEANLAALGERWYGDRLDDFVLVSAEIGIGAGIVIGGRLYRGVRGAAGELGHVVVDPDGPPCSCGSFGCLEQYAGQEALARRAGVVASVGTSVAGTSTGAVAELHRRASAGDRLTRLSLEDAGSALGQALGGMVNLLDIPTIILGGYLSTLEEWVVPAVRAELHRSVIARPDSPVDVRLSALGPSATTRGAAGAVIQQLISRTTTAVDSDGT